MKTHLIEGEIKDGELQAIFDDLRNAQETIYDCYNKLRGLGVLVIKKEPPEATDDFKKMIQSCLSEESLNNRLSNNS